MPVSPLEVTKEEEEEEEEEEEGKEGRRRGRERPQAGLAVVAASLSSPMELR